MKARNSAGARFARASTLPFVVAFALGVSPAAFGASSSSESGTTQKDGQSSSSGQSSASTSPADQDLRYKVISALVGNAQLQGSDIRVEVKNGNVTLNGTVTDRAQADHARQIAQNAVGSAKVTSNLKTKG